MNFINFTFLLHYHDLETKNILGFMKTIATNRNWQCYHNLFTPYRLNVFRQCLVYTTHINSFLTYFYSVVCIIIILKISHRRHIKVANPMLMCLGNIHLPWRGEGGYMGFFLQKKHFCQPMWWGKFLIWWAEKTLKALYGWKECATKRKK